MGIGANGQERILETSSVKKEQVVLLKQGDRTHWQKELHWGCDW